MLVSLLRKHQIPLYNAIKSTPAFGVRPIVCSRRFGKTMTILICIEEIARRHPGSIIRMAFPTMKQAQSVILPNWRKVLRTCPDDLKPVDRTTSEEGCWVWPKFRGPNGPSSFYFAGTDDTDQRERQRGSEAHWIFLDEAGSQKELRYMVEDVLGPQLDETNGRMVMVTTPPKTRDHDFCRFWDVGKQNGLLLTQTIFENTHNPPAKLRGICEKANPQGIAETKEQYATRIGKILARQIEGTPTWEREYLCNMITDKNARVVPEFTESLHVAEFEPPAYFTPYVFIDPGYSPDYFAAVFAVHDFTSDRVLVVGEWLDRKKSSAEIAMSLLALEKQWFVGTQKAPRRYYGDPRGEQQATDMRTAHNYAINATGKSGGKRIIANRIRVALNAGRLIVHARCKNLIAQLLDGTWKDPDGERMDFARSEALGHLDALDALGEGIGHVDYGHNPIPTGVMPSQHTFVVRPEKPKLSNSMKVAKQLFRGAFRGV